MVPGEPDKARTAAASTTNGACVIAGQSKAQRKLKSRTTTEDKAMTTIDPIHPGEHLAEFLDELGISQYRLAKVIGTSPATHQ